MSAHEPPMVVVGIDGSRGAEAALRFAVDEAKLRGALLRIVCAWEPSASGNLGEAFTPTPDAFVEAEHHAEDLLRTVLLQLQGDSLEVEAVVEQGGPAAILLEQAAGAELLVVGSRGRGAAKRVMLGSVSHDLANHATCPLVIVRA